MLTSAKTKRDLFYKQKSMVTEQQKSTKFSAKDVNLGTITDTLSWYKFSPLNGIRVIPKLHRRRRRIHESLRKPSQKPKIIDAYNFSEFGKHCEELLSWNHRTTTPRRSETTEIAGRAARRAKEETSAALLQSGSNDKWWSDSVECYCYLRDDQDLLADDKTQNERRFGESFLDMLCSRENLGRRYSDCWPPKWRIYISYGRWFSKIIRKRLLIPRTHSETGIHRKEREPQRRISRR